MQMSDTIAAVSTAMAPSGIGIIRISGPDAISTAGKIFKGADVDGLLANTMTHGWIEVDGALIDEVLLSVFRAPHSYTGEDTVEINCHGGPFVVKSILDAVLSCGARAAEPGEFTKRAFLNGRMDLSKAEAVMDVISAKSEYALKSAAGQLQGRLKDKIDDVRQKLLYELAFIESALDDPEHISLDGYPQRLTTVVKEESAALRSLYETAEKGKHIEEGIKTVILGRPNVGKSSLLNMLLGRERAIVTDIPGTTRDVLEDTVSLGKFALRVLDTAGIREATDEVEQIGVRLAWEKAEEADLLLYVVDGSKKTDESDAETLKKLSHKKGIVLLNKSDLELRTSKEDIEKLSLFPVIEISAKEGSGERELLDLIEEMFFCGELSFNDELFITNARHEKLIESAIASLELVQKSIDENLPEDFYSIDLSAAINALDSITGGNLSEDLVDEIFSKFCMGK